MGGAAPGGQLFLQFGDFRSEDIAAALNDAEDGVIDLGFDSLALGL